MSKSTPRTYGQGMNPEFLKIRGLRPEEEFRADFYTKVLMSRLPDFKAPLPYFGSVGSWASPPTGGEAWGVLKCLKMADTMSRVPAKDKRFAPLRDAMFAQYLTLSQNARAILYDVQTGRLSRQSLEESAR